MTASTTFFTSSPSRYRMEGSSIALPAVGTLVARTASSGQRAPIQAPTLGTCTSSVSTSGRSTAAIRRSASQFVTSPKDLGSKVKENKNRRPHQQPSSPVPLLATVWRDHRSLYRRLVRSWDRRILLVGGRRFSCLRSQLELQQRLCLAG